MWWERKEANLEILQKLERYLKTNPEIRFGQALRNLGVVEEIYEGEIPVSWRNHFGEESSTMLKRIKSVEEKHIKELMQNQWVSNTTSNK